MSDSKPPIADEHLVAYLDGELNAVAREEVENQLASDQTLRRRLVHLEQSWNLLDQLPTATVGDEFAETTVSMVAAKLAHAPARGSVGWKKWAIAASVAFAVSAVPWWIKRQRALRDLPVVQNLELYRVAESVEFLKMLDDEGLFAEDVDDVL